MITATNSIGKWDPSLASFLNARSEAEEDAALEALVGEASQHIRAVLHRRAGLFAGVGRNGISREAEQLEDMRSSAVLSLLITLHRAKAEGGREIGNLKALAGTIAANTVNMHLRERYPHRASLQGKVQHALEHWPDPKTRQPLFAVWLADRDRLCGFAAWVKRRCKRTPRYEELLRDPQRQLARTLPDPKAVKLARLIVAVFEWLRDPMVLDDLVGVAAQLQGIKDQAELSLDAPTEGSAGAQIPGVQPTPELQAMWLNSLERMWEGVRCLEVRERVVLLLNLKDHRDRGVIDLLPILGVAGLSQIAAALELTIDRLVELWPRLPLSDAELAREFGWAPGNIPVWRLRARRKLERLVGEM